MVRGDSESSDFSDEFDIETEKIPKKISPDKVDRNMSFKIKSPVGEVSKQHLHEYQAGEAVGYTVECKDGSFQVHKWCLYNSDFLLAMHKGTVRHEPRTSSRTHGVSSVSGCFSIRKFRIIQSSQKN